MYSNSTSRSSTARTERDEQNSELKETPRNNEDTENFQDSTLSTDQMDTDRTSTLIKPGEEIRVPEVDENENNSSSSPVGIQRLALFNPLARRASNEEQNVDQKTARSSSGASGKSTSPRENPSKNEVSSRRESQTSQRDEKINSARKSQASPVQQNSRRQSTTENAQSQKSISRKGSQSSFVQATSTEQDEKPISRKPSNASLAKSNSRRESTTSKQEVEQDEKPISRKPSQSSFTNNNSRRSSTTSKQETQLDEKPISRKPSQSTFANNNSRRPSTKSQQEVEEDEEPINQDVNHSPNVKNDSRRQSTTSKQETELDEKPSRRNSNQSSFKSKNSRRESTKSQQDVEQYEKPISRKGSQGSVFSKKSRTQDENEQNEQTKSRDQTPVSTKNSRQVSPTTHAENLNEETPRTKSHQDFFDDTADPASNSSTVRKNSSSPMKTATSSRRSSKKSDAGVERERVSSRLSQSKKNSPESENENSPRQKEINEIPVLDLDDLTNGQTRKSPASSRSSSAHSEPQIETTRKGRKSSDASTITEKNDEKSWVKTDNQKQTDRSRQSLARSSSNESLSDIPIVDDQSLESNSVSNTDDETVKRPVHRSRKDFMESNTNPVIDDKISKRTRTPPANGRPTPKVTKTRTEDETLQDEAKILVEKHKKPKKRIDKNDDQRQALSDTEHMLTDTQKKRRRPKRISRTCQTDERVFRRLAREAGKELKPSTETEKNTQTRKSQLRSRTRSPKRAMPVYLSTDAFRIEEILPKQFPQNSESVSRTALIAQSPLPQGGKLLILRPTLPIYHSDAVGTRRICLQYAIDLFPTSNAAPKINDAERLELSRSFPAIRSSSVAEGRMPNDAKPNSINRNQQKDKTANHRLDFRPNPSRPNQSRPNNRPV